MNKCGKMDKLMSIYIDGELYGNERLEFEGHMDACAGCRKELDLMKQIADACAGIGEAELPENFMSGLRKRLVVAAKESDAENKAAAARNKYIRAISSIAAALLLVASIKGLYGNMALKRSAMDMAAQNKSMAEAPLESGKDEAGGANILAQGNEEAKLEDKCGGTKIEGEKHGEDASSTEGTQEGTTPAMLLRSGRAQDRSINLDVHIAADADMEKEAERIKSYARACGADFGAYEALNARLTQPGGSVGDNARSVGFKIENNKYGQFVDLLAANFGRENVRADKLPIEGKNASNNEEKLQEEQLQTDSDFTFVIVTIKKYE